MPEKMGPAKGAANVQIGIRWSGVEVEAGGARARVKNIEFLKYSSSSIADAVNSTVITDNNTILGTIPANLNFSGSGLKVLRNLGDGQWVNLSYTDFARSHGYITTSDILAAGTDLTVEFSIGLPRRLVGLPSAPTGLTASLSGSSATLSWTNTAPTDPAKPYTGTSVRRRVTGPGTVVDLLTGLGPWEVIANPGVVTSFTNTGLPANSRVEYQVAGRNASGTGSWSSVSGSLYTALAAPSAVSAAKNSAGGIVITATNNALWATHLRYQDSQDGTTWADVAAPVVTSGIGVKTYVHGSPDQDITHRYRVRAERGALVSAWSVVSNVVALRQKPNPPTLLGPTGAFDPAEGGMTLLWRHNPLDTTPQEQREIEWAISTDGGATWPAYTSFGVQTTASQATTPAAGTFSNGRLRFRVRTRGAHPDWSDWSAPRQVTLTSRPVAGISFPSPGGVRTARVTPVVTYFDEEGLAQSGSQMSISVPGSEAVLEKVQAFGANPLPQFAMRFGNQTSYVATATVTNSAGLTSKTAQVTFLVSYLPPGPPEVTTEWDAPRGAVSLAITNPPGLGDVFGDGVYGAGLYGVGLYGAGEEEVGVIADTDHNELWRMNPDGSEQLVHGDIPANSAVTDDTPYTVGGSYRVVAVTADGATESVLVTVAADEQVIRRWWLNITDMVAAITYRPNRDRTSSLAQVVEHYAGRTDPVVTYGEAVKRETSLTGVLVLDEGTSWEMIEQIALTPEVAILRGPDGTRIPVAIPSTSAQDANNRRQEITLPVVRVGEDPVEQIIDLV